MANQGKRMVKENLIAQIGTGAEYTAGTGIDITEDVISVDTTTIQEKLTAGDNITISDGTISATDTTYTAGSNITISDGVISSTDTTYTAGTGIDITTNEISVDFDDVAAKSEVMATYGLQGHALTEYTTIAELMAAGCPILSTSETESTYPDNLITLSKGDTFYLQGIFALKGQDGAYRIFITSDGTGLQGTVRFNASKVANRDYLVKQARFRYNTTFDGSTVATLAMTGGGDLILSSSSSYVANSGVAGMKLPIHLANPTVNVRFDQQLDSPTSDGTYSLKVTVASGVPTFSWEADTI